MGETAISVEAFRQEARAWMEANLQRRARGTRAMPVDEVEQLAKQRVLQKRLFDGGFAGITYPVEYGGRGLTTGHERAFNEEARNFVLPNLGVAGHVTMAPIGRSIVAHGSPELKARHLPRILAGEEIWCQFYSEPEAGSDLAGIRTRATRDGDRWILNGSKIWSSGAHLADWAMCLARTDWSVPKHRGLTWFAVPTNAKGVTIRQIHQINGNAEFCEEFLDDVEVTDADVIGEVNQGWTVTQTMLVYERGAGGSGGGRGEPRELAPDLVALARRVGRTNDPAARQAIAKAHISDYTQYQLRRAMAARLRAAKTPDAAIAAYAKLAAGVLNPRRAQLGLEIGGPAALTWAPDDERGGEPALNYLNGRIVSIAAGTNEVQRNGIGERVLGLPHEPSFDTNKPFDEVLRAAKDFDGRAG